MNDFPRTLYPAMNKGMLRMAVNVPTGIRPFVSMFIITAIPETPPGAMSPGISIKLKLIPAMIAPNNNKSIFFKLQPSDINYS
jgi:hypothetical protein